MKLLLTSEGLTNQSIIAALRDLLGKPTAESNIVIIPTAHHAEPGDKSWVLHEDLLLPYQLGWKQFGIVDLAAVSSLDKAIWWPELEAADVIFVGGGNTFYLSYWMQQAGLFEVLPHWLDTKVYVGVSAGSQIMGANLRATTEALAYEGQLRDDEYDEIGPRGQSSAKTLQVTDFTFRPHLNSPNFPNIREPQLERIATTLDVPMYALDDQCALKIVDGTIEVIAEGTWRLFPAN